ncbi:response regulator [Hoeflea sp. TYP-13]|uniref:response regulator n=1 Tax=Hoeflea sp. TYP-13 TaxID=3230023 RepID=UPI0034C607BF
MARILVIDDEPLICSMLDIGLTRAGHEVMTASNGEEAISLYTKAPAQIVIVDVIMPEKDGLETIRELRDKNPGLKIIAISGGSRIGNLDLLQLAREFGATKVFNKPLDHNQLLSTIDECVGSALGENVVDFQKRTT